jgi:D-threo-aldose 1-dehydrogenase
MGYQGTTAIYPFGNTGLMLPRVLFGSSDLGNLYREIPLDQKRSIIKKCVELTAPFTVFDSAGKYGAGLALEVIGQSLEELGISPQNVVISNKLGWVRSPLLGKEPTFEPGIWKGLSYDAVQKISYHGIIECFDEGNRLLGRYSPQLVSVHDPDEYLSQASSAVHRAYLFEDILDAYRALDDLKTKGRVAAIGLGAKDWRVIPEIYEQVRLDWVMIANSLTLYDHSPDLLDFIDKLQADGVAVINAAVFNGGFLVGGDLYNYKPIDESLTADRQKLAWRASFFQRCRLHGIMPSHACIQFALSVPGVHGVAVSPADLMKLEENFLATQRPIPSSFWQDLKDQQLIPDFEFLK